jgi:anthranilate 1,2-dioxygenase small subunit
VVSVSSSYVVMQTLGEGFTEVYQADSYYDELLDTAEGLRFRQRLVVYDTARVKTLLATPI